MSIATSILATPLGHAMVYALAALLAILAAAAIIGWRSNRRRKRALPLFAQGVAQERDGEIDKAVESFTGAIMADANFAAAYNFRGVAWERKGEIERALEDQTKAIKLQPKFAKALMDRGLLISHQGQLDAAIADFSKVIKLSRDPAAYFRRGMAYLAKSEPQRAIADLNHVIRTAPEFADAFQLRATAFERVGKIEQAQADQARANALLGTMQEAMPPGAVPKPPVTPVIAIATGDPAGIGPEISLKAALDKQVRAACRPILVCDPAVIERHAAACGLRAELRVVERIADAVWTDRRVNVLKIEQPEAAALAFGAADAISGRASIASVASAVRLALAGEVDAVVAAPQNETSISMAGIAFDGHPSFVARETGTDENDVYMMLCFGTTRIVHATLHQSVRDAIAAITREKLARVIVATDQALRRLGIAKPKICVSGLNPHAGEGGLFGREEIEIISPAIEAAKQTGLETIGPFGADTMFHKTGIDSFIVMLHDQGHIPAKLLARNGTAALTIGTPILFSSVAHGSAYDIAGKGVANPETIIEAIMLLSGAKARGATTTLSANAPLVATP